MEHRSDEVAEILSEEVKPIGLVLGMSLPEQISAVSTKETIERIIGFSTSERRVLSDHDEEDNGASEQIDRGTNVRATSMNLRSHVALCAQFGARVA